MAKEVRYIYGSAAPAYQPMPERKRHTEGEPGRRPKQQPKRRVDKVAIILSLAVLLLAFYIGFSYLQKQFEITYTEKSIVKLEKQILELEKQNANELEKLDTTVDLSSVYEKAIKELGMVHAKDNQVFTYEGKKSDQIKQYGDIPSK